MYFKVTLSDCHNGFTQNKCNVWGVPSLFIVIVTCISGSFSFHSTCIVFLLQTDITCTRSNVVIQPKIAGRIANAGDTCTCKSLNVFF